MVSLNHESQADVSRRYLNDLLNSNNPYFERMVNQIYPPELQLNKASNTETEDCLIRIV